MNGKVNFKKQHGFVPLANGGNLIQVKAKVRVKVKVKGKVKGVRVL